MGEFEDMTKTITRLFRGCAFAMLASITLGASQSALAQEGPPLNTDEIIELLSGNTIKGTGYSLYYTADGKVRGKEGSYRDTGKWTAEDDTFCVRWKKWAQGKELCWNLRRDGNKIHREGVANATDNVVTWYEGNVDGL